MVFELNGKPEPTEEQLRLLAKVFFGPKISKPGNRLPLTLNLNDGYMYEVKDGVGSVEYGITELGIDCYKHFRMQ